MQRNELHTQLPVKLWTSESTAQRAINMQINMQARNEATALSHWSCPFDQEGSQGRQASAQATRLAPARATRQRTPHPKHQHRPPCKGAQNQPQMAQGGPQAGHKQRPQAGIVSNMRMSAALAEDGLKAEQNAKVTKPAVPQLTHANKHAGAE